MAFIEFLGSLFAVGSALLLSCLAEDGDFVLDEFYGLVDFCWPCGGKEVDFLEAINCFDIVGEIFFLVSFLLCWFLVFGLLLFIEFALL
jgi:hypothetical protein